MTTSPSSEHDIDGFTSSLSSLSLSEQQPDSFEKFLRLPPEIRLQIYSHVLSSPEEQKFPHPLLSVSKLVRSESASLIFKNTTLHIWRGTTDKHVKDCILYLSNSQPMPGKACWVYAWAEFKRLNLTQYLPFLGTVFMEWRPGDLFLTTLLRISFKVCLSGPPQVLVESYIPGPVNSDGVTYPLIRSRLRSHIECSDQVRDHIVGMVAGFRDGRKVELRWIKELIEGDRLEEICEEVREEYTSGRKLDALM